jgi:hypothetical protein
VEGQVTLATFKQLLDRLLKQKADIDDLLPSSCIDIMRLNVSGLKQALLPWPLKRLAELHEALPVLAAGGRSRATTASRGVLSTIGLW